VATSHFPLLAAVLCLLSASAASAQDGPLFVRGYGGVVFSQADNGGESEEAGMFGGGAGLRLSRHFAVTGDVGYMTSIASEQGAEAVRLVTSLITLVSGVNAEVTLKARTVYVLGGGRYTFGDPAGPFALYVEGQGGVSRTSFKLSITESDTIVVEDATHIFEDVIGKTTSTAPTIAAGAGADMRMSGAVSAEAGYRYLRLFGDAKANIHQIFGGVVVRF
jgi:opacity protein-like surface antigen